MLYACLCIKHICGYVWLDDFKLLSAFFLCDVCCIHVMSCMCCSMYSRI